MFVIDDVANMFSALIGLGKTYIDDKTKQVEYAEKVAEMSLQFNTVLIQSKTSPWVDAMVKLMYAFRDVVLPLMRPIGSAFLSGFAAYCQYKGIALDPTLKVIMGSAFPGWMGSRAIEKLTDKDK